MKTRFVLAGMVSLLMPACSYGPKVDRFPPAQHPSGIASLLYVAGDTLDAEVLAVEEDALLVLVDSSGQHRLAGRLARIPFPGITRGRFAHAGGVRRGFFGGGFFGRGFSLSANVRPYEATGEDLAANPEDRANLQLLSRYPQGVGDELLARLEAAYGELETLDPDGEP
ncbi:MAG: hypothetical protein OXI50_17710 [Gammaproteobacteria bacterium]|nr:hypothetical protein [Gammaproteobacteria bacterium]